MDEEELSKELEKLAKKPTNAKVFCVACGASKRTLHRWHNSYLCEECFKIARNVGDEKFIAAMKGKDE